MGVGMVFTRMYLFCLRTIFGLNFLANSVIIKCKLWEYVWWGLYNLRTFFGFIGESITPLLILAKGYSFAPFWCLCQSFLCLLYTLIKLYYTKALSDPALSLAPDWIHLLRRPKIPRLIIQQQPFSSLEVKVSSSNAGDPGSTPRSGRSPGEGNGNPLQYSCLENPTDGGAWKAKVHWVTKSQTRLSNFTLQYRWILIQLC